MARVTRATFAKWVTDLEETIEAKQDALDNAENADSPNDERIDKLGEEVGALEEIMEAVQAYIDL